MGETVSPSRRSDLRVRAASAAVMIFVAGAALSLGGVALLLFVALMCIGLLSEWWGLVRRIAPRPGARLAWMAGGLLYIGAAGVSLIGMPAALRWVIILAVIAVDTGAYFSGRRFGERKIAPSISPSKTWAGLYGGMAGAALVLGSAWLVLARALSALAPNRPSMFDAIASFPLALLAALLLGCLLAILAQAGDFFESWMKRCAGVKDSGALIPGHGGLFDRVDGLIPVAIAAGIVSSVWA